MRRNQAQQPRSGCPIGIALDVLGDPWTLLIVRDLMFKGAKTFHDFLAAGEGIATNVLTDRLTRLEGNGIVSKERDEADARRFIYRLTVKGIDLAPVLVEMVLWSTSYAKTDAPPEVVRAMRSDREAFLAQVHEGWEATQPKRRRPKTRSTG
jgi:DNA-binding HxlR family transcriptional regulator